VKKLQRLGMPKTRNLRWLQFNFNARGTSIDQGAKAIFIKFKTKSDYEFALFVMSASKKLDNKKARLFLFGDWSSL